MASLVRSTTSLSTGKVTSCQTLGSLTCDANLTAHALMNWARPQFGMANPY